MKLLTSKRSRFIIATVVYLCGFNIFAKDLSSLPLIVTYEYPEYSLPFIVALDQNLFAKSGLNVKPRKLADEQLNIQDVDVVNGYGKDLFSSERVSPSIVKFIHPFVMTKDGDMINAILVKNSAGISKWADFEQCHTILVPSEWFWNFLLTRTLEAQNLMWHGKCNGYLDIHVDGSREFSEFFTSDSAHILLSWSEDIKKVQSKNPKLCTIFSKNLQANFIANPYLIGCTYFNIQAIKNKPEAVRKYISSIDSAIQFVRAHPKEVLSLIPKYFDTPLDQALRTGVYHFYKSSEKIPIQSFNKVVEKDLSPFAFNKDQIDPK